MYIRVEAYTVGARHVHSQTVHLARQTTQEVHYPVVKDRFRHCRKGKALIYNAIISRKFIYEKWSSRKPGSTRRNSSPPMRKGRNSFVL